MKLKEIGLIVVLIALDLVTKFWVGQSIPYGEVINLIPGFLYLTNIHNTGAAWSMLEGNQFFLSIVAIAVAVVVVYLLVKKISKQETAERMALALILVGTLGNVIDRLSLGYVRDFVGVYLGSYAFPIFNVADSCLVIGVGLYILVTFFKKEEVKHA